MRVDYSILKHVIKEFRPTVYISLEAVLLLCFAVCSSATSAPCQRDDKTSGVTVSGTVRYSGRTPQPSILPLPRLIQDTTGEIEVSLGLPPINTRTRAMSGIAVYLTDIRKCRTIADDEYHVSTVQISNLGISPRLVLSQIGKRIDLQGQSDFNDFLEIKKDDLVVQSLDLPSRGMRFRLRLEDSGLYDLRSTTKPWQQSWIIVPDNPYVILTDLEGKFQLTGVPPGKYNLGFFYPPFTAQWQDEARKQDLIWLGGLCQETPLLIGQDNVIQDKEFRDVDLKREGIALFPTTFLNR